MYNNDILAPDQTDESLIEGSKQRAAQSKANAANRNSAILSMIGAAVSTYFTGNPKMGYDAGRAVGQAGQKSSGGVTADGSKSSKGFDIGGIMNLAKSKIGTGKGSTQKPDFNNMTEEEIQQYMQDNPEASTNGMLEGE